MMLVTGDVAQLCHGNSIDPIIDHHQRRRRRVLTDVPRQDAAAIQLLPDELPFPLPAEIAKRVDCSDR